MYKAFKLLTDKIQKNKDKTQNSAGGQGKWMKGSVRLVIMGAYEEYEAAHPLYCELRLHF